MNARITAAISAPLLLGPDDDSLTVYDVAIIENGWPRTIALVSARGFDEAATIAGRAVGAVPKSAEYRRVTGESGKNGMFASYVPRGQLGNLVETKRGPTLRVAIA